MEPCTKQPTVIMVIYLPGDSVASHEFMHRSEGLRVRVVRKVNPLTLDSSDCWSQALIAKLGTLDCFRGVCFSRNTRGGRESL